MVKFEELETYWNNVLIRLKGERKKVWINEQNLLFDFQRNFMPNL